MSGPASFDLTRFIDAQAGSFARALSELESGVKASHWMWFIFPQLAGLGRSAQARIYAISSLEEARAYLAHPVLGARLRTSVQALQALDGDDPAEIFGPLDALKLRSSLTLFGRAGGGPLFDAALARWYGGPDPATLALLNQTA
ncbi:DUF1810 domain-containing protein [Sphingomonas crocodyli]|uniref:DUF1810 domain-containing protein n=1 Tax=Sphingomonas crocodyli TaxID=1979270 RepID=A0A437LY81_9SPHN|nr:DUF1810 domain-containing protein [Sphingomonas crocodyli]RVT90370.1 DUF1810 domain-containing protein [Sphingomonas crocodyli]